MRVYEHRGVVLSAKVGGKGISEKRYVTGDTKTTSMYRDKVVSAEKLAHANDMKSTCFVSSVNSSVFLNVGGGSWL